MINLAGFRYRNVLEARGGPIVRLETSDFVVEDRRLFQANAYLRPELYPLRAKRAVYSEASGSGTHSSPMVARFMAISESMERWAFHAVSKSPNRAAYGFDIDPMSNGMAAFPGLFASQARRSAHLEAVERFSLIAWWEGMVAGVSRATEWPGVSAVVVWPEPQETVVILHKRTADGLYAYGHAAAGDFLGACRKAIVELARHEYVVANYSRAKAIGGVAVEAPTDRLERRSLFFASEEGHELFVRRLQSRPTLACPPREVIFDGKIPGPWEKYAHVWRCVFRPVTDRYMSQDETYFLW